MLSKFSVKKPYTVLVGVVLILILGYVSFTSMQTDLLPDMNLPYAIVYTTYVGASPEEVETVVTRPVEQSMATISNIENISSTSSENLSVVVLEFSQSANMDAVTIDIREKLDQVEAYWSDSVGSPVIMKLNPNMLPVMVAGLEVGDMSQSDLTDLVNNEILQELESIEGVASVTATGTIEEQVQVIIREDKVKEANKKVKAALDKKLDDAKEELEDGKAELEDAEAELESGQEQLVNQTSQAQGQLTTGNNTMIVSKIQLDQKLAEVESGLSDLDTKEKELNEQETQMLEGEAALNALPDQLAQLQEQQEQLTQALALLDSNPAVVLAQLQAGIDSYEESIRQLESQMGNMTDQDTDYGQDEENNLIIETPEITDDTDFDDTVVMEQDQEALSSLSSEAAEAQEKGEMVTVELPDTLLAMGEDMDSLLSSTQQLADISAQTGEYASTIAQLREKQQELITQKQTLLQSLAALGVNTSIIGVEGKEEESAANIAAVKANLQAQKEQLVSGMETIQKNIDDTPEQMETIESGKKAIAEGRKGIEEGRSQLVDAKAQLEEAKQRIESGESSVASAVGQLNSAQINASIEMAAGKAQLASGKAQIEAALEQIEDQRESAYNQSDLNEIITVDMIKGILSAQNFMMPAGYVTEDGVDFLVRVGNKLQDTEELENLMLLDLHLDGLDPIRLSDVADVVILDNSDEVYAKLNGNPGVMFSMQKQSGYSTGTVSDRIKKKFTQLENENPEIHFVKMMDQGIYIDMVVDSVIQNMLSGAGLAVIVLLVFLGSFAPTLVIACSIPISIMTALVLMYFSNITLNIISLSGLALGIGMLVDNSIVVIENIFRLRKEGVPVRKAAVEGASQVAGAIVASTLTTVCVFLPIVFTEGITRQLFVDMGLTIGYSLVASLVVALTLVPAMAAGLLRKTKKRKSGIFDKIHNAYASLLKVALKGKVLVLLLAVGLLVFSMKLSISKGTAFMPEMESTQVSVTITPPEGSTTAEAGAVTDEVMSRVMTIQDVEDVGAMIGGSGMAGMTGGSGSDDAVSMYILLKEDKTITGDELAREVLEKTADLDCEVDVETSNMDMSALGGSGVTVQIKGRDLDQLKQMAKDVADLLKNVEGTKNVSDGIEEKTLEQRLVVDKDKAMEYQLTTVQVYQFLQAKLADASTATTLSTLSKDYDVLVISDKDETLTRDKIEKLSMKGKDEDGKEVDVPLRKIVDFVDTEGFSSISREAQSRYVNVTAQIDDGYNIGLVASDVQKALDGYEVPKGYSVSMQGEDETINEAMGQVGKMLVLAVIFMYLIMVAQFQSLLSPFIIIFTIPLAFTGGFLALYLTDSPVSVIAMIGFVMLSGIIVNNGIVLVDSINQLRREGMEKKAAIVEAGRTRLRPVIMTALTTILGLCTMAAGMGMGAEMVQPMAIVTIGGLTYGTFMTLFVIPCIYDIFNRNKDMTEKDEF
ncbi:MAG: efflux RND transporter permease subunit [Muricoprocola sp.]